MSYIQLQLMFMWRKHIHVKDLCKAKVGYGNMIHFLLDVWLEEEALKVQFPWVFALDPDPRALVVDWNSRLKLIDVFGLQLRSGGISAQF